MIRFGFMKCLWKKSCNISCINTLNLKVKLTLSENDFACRP